MGDPLSIRHSCRNNWCFDYRGNQKIGFYNGDVEVLGVEDHYDRYLRVLMRQRPDVHWDVLSYENMVESKVQNMIRFGHGKGDYPLPLPRASDTVCVLHLHGDAWQSPDPQRSLHAQMTRVPETVAGIVLLIVGARDLYRV